MNEKTNASGPEEVLGRIENELRAIREELRNQNGRISELESVAGLKKDPYNEFSPQPQPVSPPPPPAPTPYGPSASVISKTTKVSNEAFEEKIGGKLFAKIGLVALVLGISFFLKYAFDNNWISEAGRVVIGIFAGLALIGIGEKTVRKYVGYGQLISGGGVAVLYLSIFAAFNFYHLVSQFPAAVLMIIITAIGMGLSLRHNAMPLFIWAIIGGFATPFLISSGENQQLSLLFYVFLLDIAVIAISALKKWREVNILGFLGTVFVFFAWGLQFYTDDQLAPTMLFLTIFFLIYSLVPLFYNILRKEKSSSVEQLLILFTAILYFSFSYSLLNTNHSDFMGIFAGLLALYYIAWAYLVRSVVPDDENLYIFLAFLAIGFATLAIPLHFHKNIITFGWLIEALILFYIGLKNRQELIEKLSLVVYSLALFKLFFIDSQISLENPLFLFNERFFTFFMAIIASYLGATLFLFQRNSETDQPRISRIKQFIAILVISANVLTIFSVSLEIVDNYGRQINALENSQANRLDHYPNNTYYSPSQTGPASDALAQYENNRASIDQLTNRRDISLSIFWLIYAIIILTVGFWKKMKGVRVGGIFLLLLSILKLFFYDLWSLGTLYRIISSISLGVVLLAISFAYQKYKDKLKEIIE